MNFLFSFSIFLAVVVSKTTASGTPIVTSPAPIGALTKIILDIQNATQAYDIEAHFQNNIVVSLNFIFENGGLNGDIVKDIAFGNQVNIAYWQQMEDNLNDISWIFGERLAQALDDIEREFALVINQPLVRSWLRQLRQLPRIGHNRGLELLARKRAEFFAGSSQYQKQIIEFMQNSKCVDRQSLMQPFTQIGTTAVQNLKPIIDSMIKEQAQITSEIIQQGLALSNNIYQAEIAALWYFVS